jgi:hypothetical protein
VPLLPALCTAFNPAPWRLKDPRSRSRTPSWNWTAMR